MLPINVERHFIMKKILSLLLALIMVFSLCACGTSPEKTLIGKWKCTDGPESFSLEFKSNGTGLFYMDKESANIKWRFIEEKTFENNETKDTITLYQYELQWEDTYSMITEAGGKEILMLQLGDHTLKYEKQ
jgi:uncharacterized lipoprotein YehR (DUF1307 family)